MQLLIFRAACDCRSLCKALFQRPGKVAACRQLPGFPEPEDSHLSVTRPPLLTGPGGFIIPPSAVSSRAGGRAGPHTLPLPREGAVACGAPCPESGSGSPPTITPSLGPRASSHGQLAASAAAVIWCAARRASSASPGQELAPRLLAGATCPAAPLLRFLSGQSHGAGVGGGRHASGYCPFTPQCPTFTLSSPWRGGLSLEGWFWERWFPEPAASRHAWWARCLPEPGPGTTSLPWVGSR